MDQRLLSEFWRLSHNAGTKREKLLRLSYKQTRLRKRLNIAAGILALLSAASVTALLADLTTARSMKILAAVLSTASGLISLFTNTGYKDSEISDLNAGAASYLNLRERANRMSLKPDVDGAEAFAALGELQDLYAELDSKFQRYVVVEDWAATGDIGRGTPWNEGLLPTAEPESSLQPPRAPTLYVGSKQPPRK